MNSDNEREEKELQRDQIKWKVRRRITIVSFVFLILISVFYLIAPFLLDPKQANVATDFNSIMITLIGFFTTIVVTYFGTATAADIKGISSKGNKQ